MSAKKAYVRQQPSRGILGPDAIDLPHQPRTPATIIPVTKGESPVVRHIGPANDCVETENR